jgi:ATP-binding cassette, subfamily B, bacterial MsbA
MKTYLRLLSFARPFNRFVPKYAITAFFGVVFGLINFSLLVPLFDVIFNTEKLEQVHSLPEFSINIQYFIQLFNYYFYKITVSYGKVGALQFVCAVILTSVLLSNIFRYWSQRVITNMRTRVVKNVRESLFNKITDLHVGYFQSQRKGDIMSSLSNDVSEVEGSVISTAQVIFREPLMLIGYLVMLFTISVKLTLFSLIILPISGLIITGISRRLRKDAKQSQNLLGNILSIIEETISGVRIIRAFNAQKYVKEKFDEQNEGYRRVLKSIFNKRELASPLSEFLGVSVVCGILLYGGILVLENRSDLTASQFLTYIITYSQVLVPAKAVSNAITNIQRGIAAGDRIFSVLETPIEITEKPNAVPVKEFNHQIEYKNVSFKYSEKKVLDDINLIIPKGQTIALVGQSGSGKSTLADLLPRFYDVTEGSILIDGTDVRDIKLDALNHLMGIVTQESILFNDSVLNNIAFGIEEVNEADVVEAAKIANAHEFIIKMTNGYHTNIGDRGSKLSGGQRQRLSIARAVLKNPPILILDEATSALDTESERLVQDALQKLMANRTSIVIAHRLSTIQHADTIIVLQDGKIVERGKHNELLTHDGIYRRLSEMQSFS